MPPAGTTVQQRPITPYGRKAVHTAADRPPHGSKLITDLSPSELAQVQGVHSLNDRHFGE